MSPDVLAIRVMSVFSQNPKFILSKKTKQKNRHQLLCAIATHEMMLCESLLGVACTGFWQHPMTLSSHGDERSFDVGRCVAAFFDGLAGTLFVTT